MIRPPNRFILTLILTLSLLSATINFQNLITDSAWASGQQEPGESSQSFASDSEIVVPPYCNWVLNLPESISFRPVDSDGVEISGFIYNGQEQNIQSTLSQETYYVAGQSGLIDQAEENNCSWFNEPGVGAGISFSLSGSTFQAYGRDPITGVLNRDTAMDIELDGSNPMSLSRIFNTACTSNGFDLGSTGLGLTATNFSQDFALVGLSPAAVSTNNFCSATSQYNMKIPANLKPYVSNTEYVWYGPTITFTAVLTTDGASTYSSLSAQEQTITFNQPADMTMVQSPQTLQATASSGLAVTLTSNTPAVCSIVSGQAVQVGSGTCSITASQPGQALNYSAATSVTRSFIIHQTVEVGDTGPGGGIIFYVSETPIKCADSLQPAVAGQTSCTYYEAAPQGWSGSASDPVFDWSTAKNRARSYVSGGAGDWDLPHVDIYDLLYLQKAAVGGFADATYWSLSRATVTAPNSHGITVNFTNGAGVLVATGSSSQVRTIRWG